MAHSRAASTRPANPSGSTSGVCACSAKTAERSSGPNQIRGAGFSTGPESTGTRNGAASSADVPAELVEDIRGRYDRAKRWTDEPMRGFGPAAVEPYALDAVVRKLKPGWYEVAVTLHSPPVPGGRVVWLAHNSFSPELAAVMWIKPEGTRYVVEVSGAFNVGAVVVKPGATAVCLSLDLRGVLGSDAEFDAG